MKASDTVMKANDLCLKVCQDHRTRTLEGKDCDGLDCQECQLEAQAEISFKSGEESGIAKGRAEVIERIENTINRSAPFTRADLEQLKEWGLG